MDSLGFYGSQYQSVAFSSSFPNRFPFSNPGHEGSGEESVRGLPAMFGFDGASEANANLLSSWCSVSSVSITYLQVCCRLHVGFLHRGFQAKSTFEIRF